MNNISKKIIVCLSIALFLVSNIVSYAATESGIKSKRFLDEKVKIEQRKLVEADEIIVEESEQDIQLLDLKSTELNALGFNINIVKRVDNIKNTTRGTSYKKASIDINQYCLIDENNEIFKICNIKKEKSSSNKKIVAKEDFEQVASQVATYYKFGNEYEIVESKEFDNDYWNIVWMRRLENGVLNPFDSVKVTIDKIDLSIVFLTRFKEEAKNVKPAITQEEAQKRAEELIRSLEGVVTEVSLCYTRPNYFWNTERSNELYDEIELVYEIVLDDGRATIYVHATTGEIIGGDISRSECAGSYGQTNAGLSHSGDCVDLATDGMVTLGYSPSYYKTLDTPSLKGYVQTHINRSDAYGFYFCGHGNSSTSDPRISVEDKNDDFNAVLYSSEVVGNWHFVFLDACHTGRTIWSNAFNISSSYSNRAYLGWDGTVNTAPAYQFAQEFWAIVGTMSIRDAAVYAANQVPGSGTTPIRFFGDATYDGSAY